MAKCYIRRRSDCQWLTGFVRKSGSNANSGKASGEAWLTVQKALEAGSGVGGGDTVYVGAGVYRETLINNIAGAASMVSVIGDNDGSKTGDPGICRLTAYTTNDKTAPAALALINLNGKSFLTVEGFHIVCGIPPIATILGTSCHDITIRRNVIHHHVNVGAINLTILVDTNNKVLVEKNIFVGISGEALKLTVPTSTVADYNIGVTFRNNVMLATTAGLNVASSGANTFKGGGGEVENNTTQGGSMASIAGTSIASSAGNQMLVRNNLIAGGLVAGLVAGASGQIVEDYNLIAGAASTNVTAGTHSQIGNPPPYWPGIEYGQSSLAGLNPRPFMVPMLDSPVLGFGASEEGTILTEDFDGNPRPAGPGPTWGTALKAAGARERGGTLQKETTTVRSGANSGRLTGPGYQDFQVPVDAVETTISVYGRYDGTYAGTLPSIEVLANQEIGVPTVSTLMTGAANAWEQVSVKITPTAKGVVVVRLRSQSTAGEGHAFWDDFSIA